jgi:hypothetical protein
MGEPFFSRQPPQAIALSVLFLVAGRVGASAQGTVTEMAAECFGADPDLQPLCLEGALALQAVRGGVGLAAASLGTPVPGSTSTLGRRLGSSPRLALSVRGGFAHADMPDPRAGGVDKHTFSARTVEVGVTVGVLDGFALLPTVGGIFSLDLLGSATLVSLSDGAGFDGSIKGLGYGVRLGLLRESFTLPGVSVSVVRRSMTQAAWGRADADQVSLTFKPTVTLVRAVAGKDLLAFGVLGGWGWERYSGSTTLAVQQTIGGLVRTGQASSGGFTSDRQIYFGGLSYTFLVLQVSAEVGYATGWAETPGRPAGGNDQTKGSVFGSVAGRLTW